MSQGRQSEERRRASRPRQGSLPSRRDDPFLRRIWHSTRDRWQRFAWLGFVLWATYSLLLSPQGGIQHWRLRSQAGALRAEIAALESQKDSLDRVLGNWDTSRRFHLERRAREEFGFLRDNERIYILPYDPEDERCRNDADVRAAERFSDRFGRRAGAHSPER